jgi:hypothetical protein
MSSANSPQGNLLLGLPIAFTKPPPGKNESIDEIAVRTIPGSWLEQLASQNERKIAKSINLENAIISGPLNLSYATFDGEVKFIDCRFVGGLVDFSFATFGRLVTFAGSRFEFTQPGTEFPVTFRGIHAKAEVFVSGCNFDSGVDFSDAHVDEILEARGTSFAKVTFERTEMSKSASFSVSKLGKRTEFGDEACFLSAQIHGNAEFGGARFIRQAIFDDVVIGGDAFFCTEQPDSSAPQSSVASVTGVLRRIQFESSARFLGAHISGSAVFLGAEFTGDAHFDRMRVDGITFFDNDSANNSVEFCQEAHFPLTDFSSGVKFNSVKFKALANFTNCKFRASTYFNSAWFEGKADFTAATATNDIRFLKALFRGQAIFSEARFSVTFFALPREDSDQKWWQKRQPLRDSATFESTVDLRGFTYERIYVDLPGLFPKIYPFDRQPYNALEKAMREAGADTLANEVYLERRTVERKRKWRRGLYLLWIGDWLYRGVANYGVRPWRILFWAAAVLLTGAFLFTAPNALDSKDVKRNSPPYTADFLPALGVSFHQFLPVDVPVGDYWVPASRRVPVEVRFGKYKKVLWIFPSVYATLCLRIFGTLLQALFIGQVTGFLRRTAP